MDESTLAPTAPRIIFDGYRVVTNVDRETGAKSSRVSNGITAYEGDSVVTIDYWMGNDPNFEVISDITTDKNTGIIKFSTLTADYMVRDLREEDGLWLSFYRIPLPVSVLKQNLKRIMEKDPMAADANEPVEELYACVFAGDDVVIGVLYDNGQGNYARVGGDWVLMNATDPAFDDIIAVPINPEMSSQFLEVYDTKVLTLASLKPFEITPE
jgi:hypothetical protein